MRSIYFDDHAPPHFHAKYAGDEALYEIETLRIYRSGLPARAHSLVLEWADMHRAELMDNWRRAQQHRETMPIEPLDKEILTMADEIVRVKNVESLDGYKVNLTFTDGSKKIVDLERFLWGPIFEPIRRNRELFEAVRVDDEAGTIVWPNGADIDPDVLYLGLKPAWMEDNEEVPA